MDGEKQILKAPSSHPSFLFRLTFSPSSLTPLLPPWSAVQGNEKWGLWSVHNNSNLSLLPPHVAPSSHMGYSSYSSTRATVLHEILHHGFFMGSQVLPSKPATAWASLSMGLQVLPGAPAWTSHGDTSSFGHPAAPVRGPPGAIG